MPREELEAITKTGKGFDMEFVVISQTECHSLRSFRHKPSFRTRPWFKASYTYHCLGVEGTGRGIRRTHVGRMLGLAFEEYCVEENVYRI